MRPLDWRKRETFSSTLGYILLGPVSGRADVGDLEILRPQEGQAS
jgi:hypothetical protein